MEETIIRKNFKNRSVVTVRGLDNIFITEYRFDNIELTYNTKYMNWQNLDCCGGWSHSKEDLVEQFKNDKKLFADITIKTSNKEYDAVMSKIKECTQMKDLILCANSDMNEDIQDIALVKSGCVADYIDIDKILEQYDRFGISLDEYDIDEIMDLAHHPMAEYANRAMNKFQYDFVNPETIGELVFTGMLLGYPLESTVDRVSIMQ